ncbi:MAG: cytokinesis protein 3 [Cirrosporium novae-zelandiae]|nr:MAG: cytokinesis protein 3 [Cirrosporium novae-zelandiae]
MATAAPALPSRFPCWCRAVYSWGGETKRDLGFIEGDLIECLNAGDGSWWMGRLRRDKRMMGLFPSNFVEVLPEDFRPPSGSLRHNGSRATSPQPSSIPKKAKTFRKPFQAYNEVKGPSGTSARTNGAASSSIPQKTKSSYTKPFQAYARANHPNPAAVARENLSRMSSSDTKQTPFRPSSRDNRQAPYRTSSKDTRVSHLRASSFDNRQSPSRNSSTDNRLVRHQPSYSDSRQPQQIYHRPSYSENMEIHPIQHRPSYSEDMQTRQIQHRPSYSENVEVQRRPSYVDNMQIQPMQHRPSYSDNMQIQQIQHRPSYSEDAEPQRRPSYVDNMQIQQIQHRSSYSENFEMQRRPSYADNMQIQQTQHRASSSESRMDMALVPYRMPSTDSRQIPSRMSSIDDRQQMHSRMSSYDDGEQTSRMPSIDDRRVPSRMPSIDDRQVPSRMSSIDDRSYNPGDASPTAFEGYHSRSHSPSPMLDHGSSPPPPPPPHRVTYSSQQRASATPSPTPSAMNDRYPTISRQPSPAPPSTEAYDHTPSPLRDAMDDVMSSLQDMELRPGPPSPSPGAPSPEPLDPWSPSAFDDIHRQASSRARMRPRTSLGIGSKEEEDDYDDYDSNEQNQAFGNNYQDRPPELNNYVQRMESRLRQMQAQESHPPPTPTHGDPSRGPEPPPKDSPYYARPYSAMGKPTSSSAVELNSRLKQKISAWELGRNSTVKSNSTNASSGVQSNATTSTNSSGPSLMSGQSAGGFSATSAGSLARRAARFGSMRKSRPMSAFGHRSNDMYDRAMASSRPDTPMTGISYHSSHDSKSGSTAHASANVSETAGIFGGLAVPKPKKSGFFKKIFESAKTGAASARSNISQHSRPNSPTKHMGPNGITAIAGGTTASNMGLGGTMDWMEVRRDVNRSNSLSLIEKNERKDRCAMMDHPVIDPVGVLYEAAEGDESIDGLPVSEPTNFQVVANLALVDKSARFINSIPPMVNAVSLSQGYICRPFRSEVQRLRAIFTWVSEKISWEEDFEGKVDTKRVIQSKRGSAQEASVLILEMCDAVGIHCEVVRGYLKTPGETLEFDNAARPNHWWNAVLVEGEWRIMDCSLASPTNPLRCRYSAASSQAAESWYFLARPMEICYTHVPLLPEQQHICPPVTHDILMALPCACPPFFKNSLQMHEFDTSMTRIENLELVHVQVNVPADVECVAEVEARAFEQDADGDFFENGDTVTKRALAQADWISGMKRYTIKGCLPGDEGEGILKVYAGKRGMMHSIKDNPHPLAFALPILHTGKNPPYEFLVRHPTPHAQRHDLYVIQPQCSKLAVNNTFVFAVRQHPSSLSSMSISSETPGRTSPMPFGRPTSALSMTPSTVSAVSSAYNSNPSTTSTDYFNSKPISGNGIMQQYKPAKLAIQAPGGKILRLMRKAENTISTSGNGEGTDGSVWETIIKIGERGTWRGLVLADRSARWCVFGEWECV